MARQSEAAAALRRALEVPIYNKTLRKDVGRGELDYEVYLHTRELLALQTPRDGLVVPDELLFQVLHQTQELWLKCVAFEVVNLVEDLDDDAIFPALAALDRIVLITQNLQDEIRVLFTLSPSRFQTIRRSLGNGSGLESPGYNQVLVAAEVAEAALDRLLARRGSPLLTVYNAPDDHADLHRVAERFVDWDGAFQSWLVEHFTLVRRTLGIDKSVKALDGFPTVALGARMMRPLFPALWNTRVEMTRGWSREGGYAPGAERPMTAPAAAPLASVPLAAAPLASVPLAAAPMAPASGTPSLAASAGMAASMGAKQQIPTLPALPALPVAPALPAAPQVLPEGTQVIGIAGLADRPAVAGEPAATGAAIIAGLDARDAEAGLAAPLERSTTSIRGEFPLLGTCVYLNSNSAGATPRAARLALDDYWHTVENWRDEAWERWWADLAEHADATAALLRAPAGSVVCDTNLATLFGRVLSCFDYRERPRIVTSDLEFPSVPFVIRAFERYGAQGVIVPSRDGATIDPEAIAAAIDERTQLVCLSHATFATGALIDPAPIVRRAREVGALVALDVYQSVGALPIDVTALDLDFALGGAHKWLCGSYESAFLYVKPALLPRLEPAATGWIASASPLSFAPPSGWADTARRFAGGTPAVLPALFSGPGLAIVRDLGLETIRALSLAHTDHVIARADEAGLAVVTPRDHARRGGIVALRFPGDGNVARALVAGGYVCSYRGAIRVAPHFYSTHREVDRFMDELIRLARRAS